MGRTRYLADTVLTCDEAETVHAPGAIDVEDGRICWVGAAAEAPEAEGAVVCDVGGLVMPGLVNAHCHTPMTLVRGAGDGLPLWRWLTEAMWPREGRMTPDDVWWGMTLGSAEMLRAGVTTSCEMYLHEEPVVEAVRASGARLVMTPGVVSALHPEASVEGRAQDLEDFHARYHDPAGRITVGVAPHSAYDLGIGRVVELAELARRLDMLLHIHIAETTQESTELEVAHGASVVRVLADHGVFEGSVLAAHCVWVDDDDIRLLAGHDVAVAHCPLSNMKLGSGVAPLARMLEAGVTVALGTDGPASNDTLDLWEEVKIAPLLARATGLDATLVGPSEVLAMATRLGGRAVGLGDVGCLAPGWAADFQRIDLDHHAFVPVTDPSELLAHVAWSGTDRRVSDVWVAGEQVVHDGVVLRVDEEQARAEVQQRAERLAAG
ncbi:MAG: amidohydrolase [Actinobacteria bacterium]|nr:amidohydrolase [Actinomycetota bacterium]